MVSNQATGKFAFLLHADVAGSTALVQQDEHLTHQRIQDTFNRFGRVIARYRGQVRELRGDALLAEFERASDALSAALTFQVEQGEYLEGLDDSVRPAVRVGIAMGEVVIADRTVTGAGVVLAQRLEQLSEPGGVVIQAAVQETIPTRYPFVYTDLGEHKAKGFEKPVHTFSVDVRSGTAIPPPGQADQRLRNYIVGLTTVILAVGVVGLMWWKPWEVRENPASVERTTSPLPDEPSIEGLRQPGIPENPALALPDKPSIAVLPFDNMSDDPGQDYFADGMSEDVITDLSRISSLFVIARNSSFAYRDRLMDVREIARELGVRYVLEGSVRRAGDQVRINVQLVDATTGGHLWAERFDGTLADVFKLQDRVTAQIVASLSVTLNSGEQAVAEQAETSVPEAYDAFLTGWRHFQLRTVDDYRTARTWLEKAVTLDPDYGRAWAALASLYLESFQRGWLGELEIDYARLPDLLDKALKGPTPLAHQVEAERLMVARRFDEAEAALDKASALDPNDPDTYILRSDLVAMQGDVDEAIALVKTAMRLDPHYSAFDLYILGTHYLRAGDLAKAIELLERAQSSNPEDWYHQLYLAAAYAEAGRFDDATKTAKALVQRRRELGFPFTTAGGFSHWSIFTDAFGNRVLDGLRKAGLRDQVRAEDLNLPPELRLTGAALHEFIFCDCRHKGWSEGGVWMRDIFSDGTGIHYWQGVQTSTTTSEIRNDIEYSERSNGRKTECSFYRNPKGTKENLDEFIAVCAHGVFPFAELPLPDTNR